MRWRARYNILVLNAIDFTAISIKNDKKISAIKTGAFASMTYVAVQLRQLPNTEVTLLVDSANMVPNTQDIKALLAKYKGQYILTLNSFESAFNVDKIVESKVDNKTVKTAHYNLKTDVAYIFYSTKADSSQYLTGTSDEPYSTREVSGSLLAGAFGPSVKNNVPAVLASTTKATDVMLHHFLPYNVIQTEMYIKTWLF
jgi:hypothetical protein